MSAVELPPYGLTLLPPWWCAVLWAGKRVENRAQSVATRIGGYRGPIAITSSATWKESNVMEDLFCIGYRITPQWSPGSLMDHSLYKLAPIHYFDTPEALTSVQIRELRKRSGMIVGVADIVDVQANIAPPTDPWAVPGQWGIRLANVREVEPVPCTGGLGFFRFGACSSCGRPSAAERNDGLLCRKCKIETPHGSLTYSTLKVVPPCG